jgi:hypothetical protein
MQINVSIMLVILTLVVSTVKLSVTIMMLALQTVVTASLDVSMFLLKMTTITLVLNGLAIL